MEVMIWRFMEVRCGATMCACGLEVGPWAGAGAEVTQAHTGSHRLTQEHAIGPSRVADDEIKKFVCLRGEMQIRQMVKEKVSDFRQEMRRKTVKVAPLRDSPKTVLVFRVPYAEPSEKATHEATPYPHPMMACDRSKYRVKGPNGMPKG